MKKKEWGNTVWLLFHTLAEKIKPEFTSELPTLVSHITGICNNLPCPDCADHAKKFWSQVKISNIKSKIDLINILFVFHNTINRRKQLQLFKYESLAYYKSQNLINSFNIFARNFNTKGNMKLLTESFHRSRFLIFLRTWVIANITHFEK